MHLLSVVIVIGSVTNVMGDQSGHAWEEGASCTQAGKEAAQDILERMENMEKKVAGMKHINDKIEQLSKTTYDLSRNTGAASEKKIKMDIHYLEMVTGCLHQCFHSMETEDKRRQHAEVKRIEDLEKTDSCLHGCMHLHPYLA
eukprot:GFUD01024209.1.p1 GENE.GFUD01024209.1~~GFUD01024209.1.p1  ORF type:complete len:143 (+),score=51.05 GFUD01024209.1:105-533(+)